MNYPEVHPRWDNPNEGLILPGDPEEDFLFIKSSRTGIREAILEELYENPDSRPVEINDEIDFERDSSLIGMSLNSLLERGIVNKSTADGSKATNYRLTPWGEFLVEENGLNDNQIDFPEDEFSSGGGPDADDYLDSIVDFLQPHHEARILAKHDQYDEALEVARTYDSIGFPELADTIEGYVERERNRTN